MLYTIDKYIRILIRSRKKNNYGGKTLLSDTELEKVSGEGSGSVPSGGIVLCYTSNVHEGCYYANQEISLTSGTIEVAYAAYVSLRLDGVGATIEIMNISNGSWTATSTGRYAPNEY